MGLGNLQSRWVLITGAAAGIGRATALAFADAGASLILTDISGQGLDAVRSEVKRHDIPCLTFTMDVADEAAVNAVADRVHDCIPALDVLVNNAGIAYLGSFLDTPLDAWSRVLNVDLMGVVHGCRAFLPNMIKAGGSRRIVNIASLAGVAPAPNLSAYSAAKHAVVGLSEGLAIELKLHRSSVGVTAVCPGIINTDITKAQHNIAPQITREQYERLRAYYEKQGVAPKVVADAIVAAVRSGRSLVLVGPYARPLYHLRRISRALAQTMLLADAHNAGYR